MTKQSLSLATALQRLDSIVEEMNGSTIDIETGLQKFEEAVTLITLCRQQLKEAENKFVLLKKKISEE